MPSRSHSTFALRSSWRMKRELGSTARISMRIACLLKQVGCERIRPRRDRAERGLGQILRRLIEPLEIIAAVMQEVAHLFVGHQSTGGALALLPGGIDLVERVQALAGAAEGDVQPEERMREPRRVGGDRLQILPVGHDAPEHRVGEGLAKVADDLLAVLVGERRRCRARRSARGPPSPGRSAAAGCSRSD